MLRIFIICFCLVQSLQAAKLKFDVAEPMSRYQVFEWKLIDPVAMDTLFSEWQFSLKNSADQKNNMGIRGTVYSLNFSKITHRIRNLDRQEAFDQLGELQTVPIKYVVVPNGEIQFWNAEKLGSALWKKLEPRIDDIILKLLHPSNRNMRFLAAYRNQLKFSYQNPSSWQYSLLEVPRLIHGLRGITLGTGNQLVRTRNVGFAEIPYGFFAVEDTLIWDSTQNVLRQMSSATVASVQSYYDLACQRIQEADPVSGKTTADQYQSILKQLLPNLPYRAEYLYRFNPQGRLTEVEGKVWRNGVGYESIRIKAIR